MRRIYRGAITLPTILLLSSLFPFCQKDSNNPSGPGTGNIILGASSTLFTGTISPAGGLAVVRKPGDSLDGLTIDVPSGAFPVAQELTIASASIQSHQFGPEVRPITPLVTVNPGSAYAQQPVTITIPVRIPRDYFGLPMVYNPASDKLEILPVIGLTDTSITTYIGDFASGSSPGSALGRLGLAKHDEDIGQLLGLFISIAATVALDLDADYTSGFLPGVNDWQFTNFGSTWAPGGHCDGQSVTMMWYFNNKSQKGAPALSGLFDNDNRIPATPTLQWDDVLGYKFCSVVQRDFNSNNIITNLNALQQKNPLGDVVTMRLFSYALKHGYGPQLVGLGGYDGNDFVGHTVLAYRLAGRKLYVADPNYPGNLTRCIQYNDLTFQPYESSLDASSPGIQFTKIYYVRYQSAFFNWHSVADRWKEFENKTIGDGKFPSYTVWVLDDSAHFIPMADGFSSSGNELALSIRSTVSLKFTAFSEACMPLPVTNNSVQLPSGKQRVGICIWDQTDEWAGFHWYQVEMGKTTADSSTIFPLATGNTWKSIQMRYQSNGNAYATDTVIVSIIDARFAGSDLWFLCTDSRGKDTTWITRRYDGIWVNPVGTTYPQFLHIQYPARAGDSYASGPDGLTQVTVPSTSSSRTVPAGTFSCYEYKRVTTGRTDYFVQYFSPGVGGVEEITYSAKPGGGEYISSHTRLVSYQVHK